MIDQFPLDVPSLFISNFASDPSGSAYTSNTLPSSDIGIGIDQPPSNTFSSNYNLVSIAATPNDYVFMLLVSTGSAAEGSGKYYIGVARDISPGYYQAGASDAAGLRANCPARFSARASRTARRRGTTSGTPTGPRILSRKEAHSSLLATLREAAAQP